MKDDRRSLKKYAKALFLSPGTKEERSSRLEAIDRISEELGKLEKASDFFQNPFILKNQKEAILKTCISAIKDPCLESFFSLLIRAKKIWGLPLIVKEYKKLLLNKENKVEAKIIVASPVDDSTKREIIAKVQPFVNQEMVATVEIDPKILGGFVFIASGKILDMSVRSRLGRMKEKLCSLKI